MAEAEALSEATPSLPSRTLTWSSEWRPQRRAQHPHWRRLVGGAVELIPCCRWSSVASMDQVPLPCRPHAAHKDFAVEDRLLGVGMSGGVHAGVCRRTGRQAAVKQYRKFGMRPRDRERLRNEICLLTSLSHPHIVELLGAYETRDSVYVVTEQLKGGEVYDKIVERKRFSEAEAASVTIQVLQAVAYMHSRSVVHRDIKPENLIFEERGGPRVKLIDFGFALSVDPKQKLFEVCGSLQYMAPEIFVGFGYNEKVDLWSVGSVLYSLLTGGPVYSGDQDVVLRKSREGQVDYGSDFRRLAPDAQALLRALLAVDPRARPSAVEALRHPWLHSRAPAHAAAALKEVCELPAPEAALAPPAAEKEAAAEMEEGAAGPDPVGEVASSEAEEEAERARMERAEQLQREQEELARQRLDEEEEAERARKHEGEAERARLQAQIEEVQRKVDKEEQAGPARCGPQRLEAGEPEPEAAPWDPPATKLPGRHACSTSTLLGSPGPVAKCGDNRGAGALDARGVRRLRAGRLHGTVGGSRSLGPGGRGRARPATLTLVPQTWAQAVLA